MGNYGYSTTLDMHHRKYIESMERIDAEKENIEEILDLQIFLAKNKI